MFKNNIGSNSMDYIIVTPIEEIFVTTIFDNDFYILETTVSIIDANDKEKINRNIMDLGLKTFSGYQGTLKVLEYIMNYYNKNKEAKMYYESDILEFTNKFIINNMDIKNRCRELIKNDDSTWSRHRKIKKFEEGYGEKC